METEKPLVLVADDEAMNREILRRFLDRLGYPCVSAENGKQAVELLKSSGATLALLDISMPVMDGITALTRIKEDPAINAVPVVMISAVSDMETIAHCIEIGADDYLIKPFHPGLLNARITNCLSRVRARETEARLVDKLKTNLAALKEAQSMRDLLSHMIVHDINNPLSALTGYASMCEEMVTDPKMREYLRRIQYAGREVGNLAQDLLQVGKLEAAALPVRMEKFDPAGILTSETDYFRPMAEWSSAMLTLALPMAPLSVAADKGLFTRVAQNLIMNAIKHATRGGVIMVKAAREGEEVVFSVADRGPGVPGEYKARVFEKYFQIEARQRHEKFGAGLGLTFCKMAVEALKGRIWVEDNPGGGAVFNFTLPAAG